MIDRLAVYARIKAILEEHSTPTFKVVPGEPVGPPGADGSPFVCFWYMGRTDPVEGGMTMGQRMNLYRFQIMGLWHRRPELSTLEEFEAEIWEADVTLRAAFWADYTLNNESTALTITDPSVDYTVFPIQVGDGPVRQVTYRSLDFELQVLELEGETIAA